MEHVIHQQNNNLHHIKEEEPMKKYIIDRFEDIYAVCEKEDKSFINIPKSILPEYIKEGDCIIQKEDGTFSVDVSERLEREHRIREKMNHLFE